MDAAPQSSASSTPESGESPIQEVSVRVAWDEPLPPISFANVLLGQVDDAGDIVLHLGQVMTPALPEDAAVRRKILEGLAADPVVKGQLLARFAVSPERVRKMIKALEAILALRESYLEQSNQTGGR